MCQFLGHPVCWMSLLCQCSFDGEPQCVGPTKKFLSCNIQVSCCLQLVNDLMTVKRNKHLNMIRQTNLSRLSICRPPLRTQFILSPINELWEALGIFRFFVDSAIFCGLPTFHNLQSAVTAQAMRMQNTGCIGSGSHRSDGIRVGIQSDPNFLFESAVYQWQFISM